VPSSGGVFEITVNGKTIYSKKATGQFPDPETILQQIRNFR
jgi:selenoprotein W-related protein